MAKEYIERDALIAEYDRVHVGPPGGARKLMVDAPTADVAEVKHGEWTKVEVNGNGYGQIYYQHENCPVSSTELHRCPYEHCPRCGAKMDGGKAE